MLAMNWELFLMIHVVFGMGIAQFIGMVYGFGKIRVQADGKYETNTENSIVGIIYLCFSCMYALQRSKSRATPTIICSDW